MRKQSIVVFVLTALSSVAAQTGCISVTVTDYKGLPLPNLHGVVTRYVSENWFQDTDSKGSFKITGLPPGNYSLMLRNYELGYMDIANSDFTNVSPPPTYVVESGKCTEVNLQREPPAARLHLKLTDEETGKFIEEPEAQFRRTDGHHAWNGTTLKQLDLLVPPLKPLEVRIGAKGYKSTAAFTIAPPLQPGEIRDFDAVLKPIGVGCLRGRILDADGQPVVGIEVQPMLMNDNLNSKAWHIQTNQDGEYELKDAPPGTYQIFVHSKEMGYDSMSIIKKDGKNPQAEVLGSGACAELDVSLSEPNGKLVVEVVDAATHAPLEHFKFRVKATVPPWWYSEGVERIREIQIPVGRQCSVQAQADGYEPSQPMPLASFKSGEVRKITISLQPVHQGATKPSQQN